MIRHNSEIMNKMKGLAYTRCIELNNNGFSDPASAQILRN